MTKAHRWIVDGERTIYCGGCAASIQFTLSRLPGVQQVRADFRTQQIEVEAGGEVDVEQIVAELAELDYTVREMSRDEDAGY